MSIPTFTELGLAALVLLAVFFVFIYFIVQLRRRRAQLADEPRPSREQLDDRAFNQIHIARASAERLQRSGVDVGPVLTLLDNAERARARGDPDTATALAKSAQGTLVQLRSSAPTRVPGPEAATASPSPLADGAWLERGGSSNGPVTADASPPAEAPSARLPKNKAESRFQINLLTEDLRRAATGAPSAPETTEAQTILRDAQSAFDRGDYTEALRLGLRGRRRVGGRLETLAPSRATQLEPASEDGPTTGPTLPADPGPGTCAHCGAPMKASDGFCRACGSPRSAARCGQCGEALAPGDRFCGACGGPIRT